MFASNLNLSHPKLPLYADRLKRTVDLAFIKALAHHKNPSQNPLPADPKSLERALYNVFRAIPKRKQDDAAAKFQNVMTAAQRASVYGDLGQINFASSVSVVEQVKALPLPATLKFTAADVGSLQQQIEAKTQGMFSHLGDNIKKVLGSSPQPQQAIIAKNLDFAVISATCLKPNDLLKDETNLAVGAADSFGAPFNAGPFFVGKFKKGDTINLGATGQLFTFNIADAVFPATFPVTALMVESDWIHNTDLANKLIIATSIAASALATTGLTICILGAAGVITAPAAFPIFIAIEISALALLLTSQHILPLLADDISFSTGDALVLAAPPEPGDTFDRTIVIDKFGKYGRGIYNVLLRWTARE
jgi:hypothetical protein